MNNAWSFILYIKMASLTSNLTSIKIRGVHKAKHEIDLATTTLGDIKTWIKTKVEDNDLMLKLFVKGKTFEGSETDTMLASDAGIKKGSVVKALRSTAVAVQNKAKQMSAEPGAKTVDAGPRQRCKGFILYIKMASLTSNLTSIKIRGVHKAKHEIDLATTTLGDIKTWIKTKVEDNDLMLKLFLLFLPRQMHGYKYCK